MILKQNMLSFVKFEQGHLIRGTNGQHMVNKMVYVLLVDNIANLMR